MQLIAQGVLGSDQHLRDLQHALLLIGADLVELNPSNDQRDITARVAAKAVKEIVGRLLSL